MSRTPSLTLIDPARQAHLAQRIQEAKKTTLRTHSLTWRGIRQDLPIVRVESTYLLYNIDNGRTAAEQARYALREGRSDLFNDPSSTEAQQAQHRILKDLDKRAFDDLMKDLKERSQQFPGIVTASGVLVNGNRRVAACRELAVDYVDVVILDASATARELHDLEVDLQMARDFKEDYSHVNRLLVIRRMEEDGHSPEEIAQILRLSGGGKKIRQEIGTLALMEELVAEVGDLTFQLADLADSYQVFSELAQEVEQLEMQQRPDEAGKLKNARFLAIKVGVGYREARHIDANFFDEYLQDELIGDPLLRTFVDSSNAIAPSAPAGDLGDLAALTGASVIDGARSLLKALPKRGAEAISSANSATSSATIGARLRTAIEVATQAAKDDKNSAAIGEVPLQKARAAVRALRGLDIAHAKKSAGFDPGQLSLTLTELRAIVEDLLKRIG